MKALIILTLALTPIALVGQTSSRLGKPLGKTVTVQGIIIDGPSKGYESGPNILVQRIDGAGTQESIRLLLTGVDQQLLPGKAYEIKGVEGRSIVGGGAQSKSGEISQASNKYSRSEFKLSSAKAIAAVAHHPREFKGRTAMFEGVAVNERGKAWIKSDDGAWRILVSESVPWRADLEGKRIETRGVHKSAGMSRKEFTLQSGRWRPVNLEDQLGERVKLHGTAKSLNDVWWFDWRGTGIYVRDLERLKGWTGENHYRQIVITGRLGRMKMPDVDQIALRARPDMIDTFVIDQAAWEPLPDGQQLLAPELSPDQVP